MECPSPFESVLTIERFAHLLFSAAAHLLPLTVPMPPIILFAFGLHFGRFFVFLPAIVVLVDYSLAATSTITVLLALLCAFLRLTMAVVIKSPDLLLLLKGLPPMPCLLSLQNMLLHIVTVLLGHRRGQIPPSKLYCP